jgi:2-deoxy-D-gluconate 3-dehydrogenase
MNILDSFRLDGKVALVTGAFQGLGQAMAVALAEAGADIACIDYNPQSDATQAVVQGLGRNYLHIQADLIRATAADLNRYVAEIVEKLGRLDILVNNAGIIRRAPALEFSEKDWDDVININQKTVFFMSQAAARQMVKQGGGKIINIASMLSFQGGILVPSYTASKSAVAGLTRLMANEWAKFGINANAIAPGYMATDNTAPLRADPARSSTILDRIPAGRWGEPKDLRGVVVFLASSASDYMNAAIVPVDGGWLAR